MKLGGMQNIENRLGYLPPYEQIFSNVPSSLQLHSSLSVLLILVIFASFHFRIAIDDPSLYLCKFSRRGIEKKEKTIHSKNRDSFKNILISVSF